MIATRRILSRMFGLGTTKIIALSFASAAGIAAAVAMPDHPVASELKQDRLAVAAGSRAACSDETWPNVSHACLIKLAAMDDAGRAKIGFTRIDGPDYTVLVRQDGARIRTARIVDPSPARSSVRLAAIRS